MPVSTVTEVPTNKKRLDALRAKHKLLSDQVDDARKQISANDFYINQLKKKKLLIKEKLYAEEERMRA